MKHSILSDNWMHSFHVRRKRKSGCMYSWSHWYKIMLIGTQVQTGKPELSLDGRIWGDFAFFCILFLHYLLWNSFKKKREREKRKKKKNPHILPLEIKKFSLTSTEKKSQARLVDLFNEVGFEKTLNTCSHSDQLLNTLKSPEVCYLLWPHQKFLGVKWNVETLYLSIQYKSISSTIKIKLNWR